MVALGTKDSAGSGFDDYGGELEIHRMNFADRTTRSVLVGCAKATSRFASIAWSKMATKSAEYGYGLIATGMIDGTINVWDPALMASDHPDPLIAAVEQHTGAIHGLQFNPHRESSHLLASGGSDGEVYVMSLDRPDTPNVFIPAPPPSNAKHTADVTKVAWNTQVAHIMASSSQNGSCIVWDLRQKKAWCELREPSGCCISDIAWNPDQGLHLVTAGGDDKNPVIKLWDLRSSTSLPLATLQGHTEGILSVSWCPSDPSLLLSCGKDNRTMLWDLFHLQSVYELPTGGVDQSQGGQEQEHNMFGGLASAVGNRRYHVSWSPCLPAVISTCSFDRSVQFYSLSGAKSKLGRAPKWLRKSAGASFGFGGKLASFTNRPRQGAADQKKSQGQAPCSVEVKIHQVIENTDVVNACDEFHNALASEDFNGFCRSKVDSARTEQDKRVWGLMRVICFENNAREELLSHLGFDKQNISRIAEEYVSVMSEKRSAAAGESVPSTELENHHLDLSEDSRQSAMEILAATKRSEEAEPMIRKALVVGNFEAAVDCCLEAGLMTEALLLAQCGDSSLWTKTQNFFFEHQRKRRPFLNILQAVIKNELMDLVMSADLSRWKETLAILSTYGKSDEFPAMCEALATRLETEAHDIASATLCYMCATSVSRTVGFWVDELRAANAAAGHMDTMALQEFVEKVIVYTRANPSDSLGEACSVYFAEYAKLLASQGKLDVAPNYLKGDHIEEQILRDRLYHGGSVKPVGSRPPPFPFEKQIINTSNEGKKSSGTLALPSHAKSSSSDVGSSTLNPQKQQQHQQMQTQQPSTMQAVPSSPTSPSLPPGWLQLVDPNSNRPYFVDQSTGQSQWEPPQAQSQVSPAPMPSPVPVTSPAVQQQQQQQPITSSPHGGGMRPATAPSVQQQHPIASSSHGSGARSAAQEEETSRSYTPSSAERQITAPSASSTTSDKPTDTASTSGETKPTVDSLLQMLSSLEGKSLSGPDKRSLTAVNPALACLQKQMSAGQVSTETMEKLEQLVSALANKQSSSANAIHTELVNAYWAQHKDW
eukprot:CAMPEP_0185030580 /NCGR_PEP_ID=MMETSP1103-20130426/17560_1 /TAXON_ID=36769 /ORGANISM="Paraphysomonas bandaiensis, Strain Caron Lab Isolate" /LENGTH=1052 /DNA_ID=CAMNT_0027565771 /DNA_START=108 /DNA_END=3263 /DNA_ORIENTATION=+